MSPRSRHVLGMQVREQSLVSYIPGQVVTVTCTAGSCGSELG